MEVRICRRSRGRGGSARRRPRCARRMGERAAQMQGVCMVRLGREHLRIEPVRLRELPGLMMPEAGTPGCRKSWSCRVMLFRSRGLRHLARAPDRTVADLGDGTRAVGDDDRVERHDGVALVHGVGSDARAQRQLFADARGSMKADRAADVESRGPAPRSAATRSSPVAESAPGAPGLRRGRAALSRGSRRDRPSAQRDRSPSARCRARARRQATPRSPSAARPAECPPAASRSRALLAAAASRRARWRSVRRRSRPAAQVPPLSASALTRTIFAVIPGLRNRQSAAPRSRNAPPQRLTGMCAMVANTATPGTSAPLKPKRCATVSSWILFSDAAAPLWARTS